MRGTNLQPCKSGVAVAGTSIYLGSFPRNCKMRSTSLITPFWKDISLRSLDFFPKMNSKFFCLHSESCNENPFLQNFAPLKMNNPKPKNDGPWNMYLRLKNMASFSVTIRQISRGVPQRKLQHLRSNDSKKHWLPLWVLRCSRIFLHWGIISVQKEQIKRRWVLFNPWHR